MQSQGISPLTQDSLQQGRKFQKIDFFSCCSTISYIDGDKGELLYRGYPIEQIADQASFVEVCYLLIYGCLP